MKISIKTKRVFSHGGEPIDPSDRWTDHTPAIYIPSVMGVYKDDEGDFEVPDSTTHAWVVWTSYSEGCTFTTTRGYIQIVDVFASEDEAEKLAQDIRDFSHSNKLGNLSDKYTLDGTGYFGSIQEVRSEYIRIK